MRDHILYDFTLEEGDTLLITPLSHTRSVAIHQSEGNFDVEGRGFGRNGFGFSVDIPAKFGPALIEAVSKMLPFMNRDTLEDLRLDLYKLQNEINALDEVVPVAPMPENLDMRNG